MFGFFKKKLNTLKPPRSYFVELTNYCNLRCSMCNFHSPIVTGKREKGFMDISLAKNIIDQIGKTGFDSWVALHGAGEPLLHKGLIDILKFASKHENIRCGFLTNAVLLDEEVTHKILDAGISWIGFSVDGIVKEKFEKYRVGSDFERIINNVLYFLELNNKKDGKVKTLVNMTVQDEMKEDVDKFIDFWIDKVDEVAISPCRPVGSRENVLVDEGAKRVSCYMLYEMMVIFWDGKVGLCCEDWFNDEDMGDMRFQGLEEIWNGTRFNRARRLHEKGSFDKIPLCRDCNSWFRGSSEEKDEKRQCMILKNAWQYVYKRH